MSPFNNSYRIKPNRNAIGSHFIDYTDNLGKNLHSKKDTGFVYGVKFFCNILLTMAKLSDKLRFFKANTNIVRILVVNYILADMVMNNRDDSA